jgi:hypothetical protein
MGSRLVDTRLTAPLAALEPILHRHDAVEVLAKDEPFLRALRAALASVPDLERTFTRVGAARTPAPRDLLTLRDGLAAAHRVGFLLASWDPALFDHRGPRGRRAGAAEGGGEGAAGVPAYLRAPLRRAAAAAGARALSCARDELDAALFAAARADFDVSWAGGSGCVGGAAAEAAESAEAAEPEAEGAPLGRATAEPEAEGAPLGRATAEPEAEGAPLGVVGDAWAARRAALRASSILSQCAALLTAPLEEEAVASDALEDAASAEGRGAPPARAPTDALLIASAAGTLAQLRRA